MRTHPQEGDALSDISSESAMLEKLRVYTSAVHQIRYGEFFPECLNKKEKGDIGNLVRELKDLGQWLAAQFEERRQLQKATALIASGASLDEFLDGVWVAFLNLIPYDRIGCALVSEDGLDISSAWARSSPDVELRLKSGFTAKLANSSLDKVIKSGKPRILNNLEAYLADNPKSVSTGLIVEEGIRSSLTCPLINSNKKVIGVLFFSSKSLNTYSTLHKDVFIQIAELVSTLVEKSSLYQKILALNHELRSVNHELLKAQAVLKEQATRDELTGLLNRRAIYEIALSTLAQASRSAADTAVISIDIDHFKHINDTYGHQAGDAVLCKVASVFEGAIRAYDSVGRFGGEEFLIVLPNTTLEEAHTVAERIRCAIELTQITTADTTLSVTVSQGVAHIGLGSLDQSAKHLLARADVALYAAKHAGRNQVILSRDEPGK